MSYNNYVFLYLHHDILNCVSVYMIAMLTIPITGIGDFGRIYIGYVNLVYMVALYGFFIISLNCEFEIRKK